MHKKARSITYHLTDHLTLLYSESQALTEHERETRTCYHKDEHHRSEKGAFSLTWVGVKFASQTSGPGLCFNASCAITSLNGSGTNLSLSINNQSGPDRLQYGWGGTGGGEGGGYGRGAAGCWLESVPGCASSGDRQWNAARHLGLQRWIESAVDRPVERRITGVRQQVPRRARGSHDRGDQEIWDCNGGTNQQWTLNSDGTVVGRGSGLCLDVIGVGTANGTGVEIWTCNGGSNQKWVRQ